MRRIIGIRPKETDFMDRRTALGAIGAACASGTSPLVQAQAFPDRQVRIIVPFAAGSTPDVVARILAAKLTPKWGQQVVVDPKPGGNGLIAIAALKAAPSTGHDLMLASSSHLAVNPHLLRNVTYSVERDFVPVSFVFHTPFFFVTSAAGPLQSMKSVIAAAKASPGKLNVGVPYLGSPPHLAVAMLEKATGTRMTIIPFRDGQQIYTAIASGEVDLSLATIGSTLPLVQAGKLKLIAIAAPNRLARQPDVPTVGEDGGPAGYDVNTWVGLVARSGAPQHAIQKISDDVAEVLRDPEVVLQFVRVGIEPESSSPAVMRARMTSDTSKYAEVIKRLGVTIE